MHSNGLNHKRNFNQNQHTHTEFSVGFIVIFDNQSYKAMHGIGVDILHVPRLANLLRKGYTQRLAKRILTPTEQTKFNALPATSHLSFLATHWALKEASWKASQPIPSSWKDMEVDHSPEGQPQLYGTKGLSFKCSVSHDGEYVVAYVIAQHVERGGWEVPRERERTPEWLDKW